MDSKQKVSAAKHIMIRITQDKATSRVDFMHRLATLLEF